MVGDPAIVQQFIDRYNYGHVGHKDKLGDYLNDQPIQKVLEVYQLDPEKFWYFLLFAVDYTEGLGSFFTSNPTPLEQFEKVFPLIEANLQPHVFPQGGYVFKDDPNMKLTLTVKRPVTCLLKYAYTIPPSSGPMLLAPSAPTLLLPAVLRFREIHLEPASVDYQLVSRKLGCR